MTPHVLSILVLLYGPAGDGEWRYEYSGFEQAECAQIARATDIKRAIDSGGWGPLTVEIKAGCAPEGAKAVSKNAPSFSEDAGLMQAAWWGGDEGSGGVSGVSSGSAQLSASGGGAEASGSFLGISPAPALTGGAGHGRVVYPPPTIAVPFEAPPFAAALLAGLFLILRTRKRV